MEYKVNFENYSSVFAIPTSVVDEHIKMCSARGLKVLLIVLRNPNNIPEVDELAKSAGFEYNEDVIDVLNFWVDAGVLIKGDNPAKKAITENKQKPNANEVTVQKPNLQTTASEKNGVKLLGKRETLQRNEAFAIVDSNEELKIIIDEFQSISGKILTSSDVECFVALYTYYGLSADYILMAAHYCYSIGKCNMRYVEKAISSWLDIGIDTHEKLDIHIKKLNEQFKNENVVKSAFGINDRALASSEKKLIDKWCNEYQFNIQMIKFAYERTIENIGKLSFNYLDTILSNWNTKGIKTPKDANEEVKNFKKQNDQSVSSKVSYSYDELDDIINNDFIK